jgi:hypothetical protein
MHVSEQFASSEFADKVSNGGCEVITNSSTLLTHNYSTHFLKPRQL